MTSGEAAADRRAGGPYSQVLRPWPPALVALALLSAAAVAAARGPGLPLPSTEETWRRLPRAERGAGQPLPAWARALAPTLPHTTAAMLELDDLHRSRSPLPPALRARLRWVAAHAVGCAHGTACAAADLRHAGADPAGAGDFGALPEAERAAVAFVRTLATRPQAVTDDEVARLVRLHGEKPVVAMVLLAARATFQDRLLLALDLAPAPGEPLRPLDVRFTRPPPGTSLAVPRRALIGRPPARATPQLWPAADVKALEAEVERQRTRRPRIPLPPGEAGGINWGLACRTYQPELAAGWSACRRCFEAETDLGPVFAASLFWVVTHVQQSFY